MRRDVIVVGASAGGVEALSRFVAALPATLPATILIVLHMPVSAPSALPVILARRSKLPTSQAEDGDPLTPFRVLVARPNRHLVVHDSKVWLTAGPRENGHRPSVDVLFRSAAEDLGPRVMAVVLSGTLDDGVAGAAAVRARGGLVFVQDADDALYPNMPTSVAQRSGADGIADVRGIAQLLTEYSGDGMPASEVNGMGEDGTGGAAPSGSDLGPPTGFMCPDCSGSLYLVSEEPLLRFRCRVGHAWNGENLVRQQDLSFEAALWTALRTLEEKADLCTRLAERAAHEGHTRSSQHFEDSATRATESARLIRGALDALLGQADGEAQTAS